jgi:hypothetical protein
VVGDDQLDAGDGQVGQTPVYTPWWSPSVTTAAANKWNAHRLSTKLDLFLVLASSVSVQSSRRISAVDLVAQSHLLSIQIVSNIFCNLVRFEQQLRSCLPQSDATLSDPTTSTSRYSGHMPDTEHQKEERT